MLLQMRYTQLIKSCFVFINMTRSMSTYIIHDVVLILLDFKNRGSLEYKDKR